MKHASSLPRHIDDYHTDDQHDHVQTVQSRGKEYLKSEDPYENVIMPRWDDPRYPKAVAPKDHRGVWTDARDSINAVKAKHANWELPRPLTQVLSRPDSEGRLIRVFGPTAANKKQGVMGMPVIRRVGEHVRYEPRGGL